ncbi:hypothetical protein BJ684DRAFT_236, partial [Piptocephalis cylindrospora]
LPFIVAWQDLKDLFRECGTVLRANIMYGRDGRSRGYGTVLYASAEEAANAIQRLNGFEWYGRRMEVREDRSIVDVQGPSPAPQSFTGDASSVSTNENGIISTSIQGENGEKAQIFVGNLPFDVQWPVLKELFRTVGHVIRADIVMGPEGKSRGYGTVLFATAQEARQAIDTFDGHLLHGRSLHVRMDK